MVPVAGRGEWQPPSARGSGDGADHLRGRPGGIRGSGRRGGVLTALGAPLTAAGSGEVGGAFGSPLAGCLLPRPHREIVKVSGFLGVHLSAGSGQESPPRARGTGLGGASGLHPQLVSEPLRQRHSSSLRRPPPPRRVVTLRATIPGTPSERPGRVTPLIPGFSPTGASRAESWDPHSLPLCPLQGWLIDACHTGR